MNAVASTASSTSPTQALLTSTVVNASLVQQQQQQQPQQHAVSTGVPTIVQTVGGSSTNVAVTNAGGGAGGTTGPTTVITTTSLGLHDDVIRSPPSTPESEQFDDSDLLTNSAVANDEITQRLMAAGTIGLAAAAAIATGKKRKRPHSFETDPSIRRRQQTRLLRDLKRTIDEYTTRIGQQAVVMIATPGKPTDNFKVFGAQPLENVMRDLLKSAVITELENALAAHAPPITGVNGTPGQVGTGTVATNGNTEGLHDLPPLIIDGIPTPVEKMTQAQLRCFIPLMLKYSTGRGKPGWGRESTRPPWWPQDLPWANVRSDVRSDEDKQRVSWTHALRQIVINCYRYHGREDLLPAFGESAPTQQPTVVHSAAEVDDDNKDTVIRAIQSAAAAAAVNRTGGVVAQASQTGAPPPGAATAQIVATQGGQTLIQLSAESLANAAQTIYQSNGSIYGTTMVQAINNPDGSVSIIQVDPATTVVTLADGTQAQLRTMSALPQTTAGVSAVAVEGGQVLQVEDAGTVGTVVSGATVETVGGTTTTVEMAGSDAVATLESALSQGGQIILTGEDGSTSFPVGSMVAIPVSMYHHSGMQVMQTTGAATADESSPPAGHDGGGEEVELVTGPD
ncbi:DNA-binding protein P3A2-like [Tropilaelaps mercedesae]|uniref:DNA-binding protein P3A2-like n=1 Tax=Tropilaelaps mercedesae TaxID=418985 RepID=A0A1V9XAP4_9ACAR|nr:DNA-binding protein P3A2-like [Tropilaelaps mercedesae]